MIATVKTSDSYLAAKTSLAARRLARQAAGAHASCPVDITAGNAAPKMTGQSYYWTTPSGKTRIRHPSSYRWPMWYHHSTIAVQVGIEWLAQRMPDVAAGLALGAGI